MATLAELDGFAHQVAAIAQSGSGFIGTYDAISNGTQISFDAAVKRLPAHVASLKVDANGSATFVRKTIPAGNRTVVESIYFRLNALPSSGTPEIFSVSTGTINFVVRVSTAGVISTLITGGSAQTGPSIVAGQWYRCDLKADSSSGTFTLDVSISGTAITQATVAQTAADITQRRAGVTSASTLLVNYQDWVSSVTGTDHPIGAHVVLPLYPTGEGTETLGSTNKIQDEGAGQTNLYTKVDDWNGGVPSTADYVTYASTTTGDAASNFAEFMMSDPTTADVWDVIGYIAGFASGTGADAVTCKVMSAHGGTQIDTIGSGLDYSGSASVLGYYRKTLARPSGGWDTTKLGAVVLQWGFATDTNAKPQLTGIMLEYAATSTDALDLVVADAAHAHTAEAPVLTQVHNLTVANAADAETAENVVLSQVHVLAVADASHAESADNLALTVSSDLAVQDSAHAHTAENLALTQVHQLAVADAAHAENTDNPILTQAHNLSVADGSHAQTADNLAITVSSSLAVQDAAHAHAADNVILTQVHALALQDGTHAETAGSPVLTQVHNLAVQDPTDAQTAENVVLGVAGQLGVQDAAHAQTAENVILSQVHNLSVQDAVHAQSADNVVLAVAAVDLIVADAAHAQTVDGLGLTQVHGLILQDAAHVQAVENLILSQLHELTVSDTTHLHSGGNIVLIVGKLADGQPPLAGTVRRAQSEKGTLGERGPGTVKRADASGVVRASR